jgi:hypothetical protein
LGWPRIRPKIAFLVGTEFAPCGNLGRSNDATGGKEEKKEIV